MIPAGKAREKLGEQVKAAADKLGVALLAALGIAAAAILIAAAALVISTKALRKAAL